MRMGVDQAERFLHCASRRVRTERTRGKASACFGPNDKFLAVDTDELFVVLHRTTSF